MSKLDYKEEPIPLRNAYSLSSQRDISGGDRVRLYDTSSDSIGFVNETIADSEYKNELYGVAYLTRRRVLSNGESIVTNVSGPKFVLNETKKLEDGLLPFLNEDYLALAQKAYDGQKEYDRQSANFRLTNPGQAGDFESNAKNIPPNDHIGHERVLLKYWLSNGFPDTTIRRADLDDLHRAVFEDLFDEWRNGDHKISPDLQARLGALEDSAQIIVRDILEDIKENKRLKDDSYFFCGGIKVGGVSIPLPAAVTKIFNLYNYHNHSSGNGTFKQFVGYEQRNGFCRLLFRRVAELLTQKLPDGYECKRGSVFTYFDVNKKSSALEQRVSYWINKASPTQK